MQEQWHSEQGNLSLKEDDNDDVANLLVAARRGVRFPASQSLENICHISRLSERALEEICAVWGDEEEECRRKQTLHEDLYRVAAAVEGDDDEEGWYDFDHDERPLATINDEEDANDYSDDLCSLGLLDKIGGRAEVKMQRRRDSWDAVLMGQHILRDWDEEEEEEAPKRLIPSHKIDDLAKAYTICARTSEVQLQAQEEARQLELEVRALVAIDADVKQLLKQGRGRSRSPPPRPLSNHQSSIQRSRT